MRNEKKNTAYKITVQDMSPHVHNFSSRENKVDKIAKWLINWIILSLDCGKIKPYDLLPSKADLACHIGVSQGTVQNAYRIVEDLGYLESKQRIGTYIKDYKKNYSAEKLTSKRELTIEIIKKYLSENNYRPGDKLPSTRKLASFMGVSSATIRTAILNLLSQGILDKQEKFYVISDLNFHVKSIETKTLVEKVSRKIEIYIAENLDIGNQLPNNMELARTFKVSVKTIHDAIKHLYKRGILYPRRGRYGTIVCGNDKHIDLYDYEKIEQKIKTFITTKCKIGDKLPCIRKLAKDFNTSEKTIKKALNNLSEDGYLTFARGRYGGTFIVDIPQISGDAYKWLAINSEYISN